MSKIGNHRIGIQEGNDYRFGWESAERGEPFPQWEDGRPASPSLAEQRRGWTDFHNREVAP